MIAAAVMATSSVACAGERWSSPAPGIHGPYDGAGRRDFYHVTARLDTLEGRLDQLNGPQRARAAVALRSIGGELATQRRRHGELRDWDRERATAQMNALLERYPILE